MIGKILFIFYVIYLGCAVPVSIGMRHNERNNKLVWADSVNLLLARELQLACLMGNCVPISESIGSGTSFIIDHVEDKTIVMTAAHLCKNPEEYGQSGVDGVELKNILEMGVVRGDGFFESKKILYNNPINDICIFSVDAMAGYKAPIARMAPRYGDKIWSIGAPAGYFPESAKPITHGFFSGEAERAVDPTFKAGFYNFSMPTIPGMSGSPIFNDNGEVVGIVSAVHYKWHMISYSPTHKQIVEAVDIAMTKLKNQDLE